MEITNTFELNNRDFENPFSNSGCINDYLNKMTPTEIMNPIPKKPKKRRRRKGETKEEFKLRLERERIESEEKQRKAAEEAAKNSRRARRKEIYKARKKIKKLPGYKKYIKNVELGDDDLQSVQAMNVVLKMMKSPVFMDLLRANPEFFTQNGKINPIDIIVEFLHQNNITGEAGAAYYSNKYGKAVTRQSIATAVEKINPEAIRVLNTALMDWSYINGNSDTFKGYPLIAVDGCKTSLTNEIVNKLKDEYGYDFASEISIMAGYFCYDILNKRHFCYSLNHYHASERDALCNNLGLAGKIIRKPMIFIGDRGTTSIKTMYDVDKSGNRFVFRLDERYYKEITSLMNDGSKEKEGWLEFDDSRLNNMGKSDPLYNEMKELGGMMVRIVRYTAGGNDFYVLTNLTKEEMSYAEVCEIYRLRWGIETSFKKLKDVMKINDFHSTSINHILLKFHTGILAYNMQELIVNDAQRIIDGGVEFKLTDKQLAKIDKELIEKGDIREISSDLYKHIIGYDREYQINFSLSYAIVKKEIFGSIYNLDNMAETIKKIILEIIKRPQRIRKGRKYKIQVKIKKGATYKSRKNETKI